MLTSKSASRHNGVHFFETRHLSLQKWSEHGVVCTFWLRNVLRATAACTFSKLDLWASKSGSNPWCFAHFDFEMCFVPQRRALFRNSTSEPPKVVRTPSVFNILTWKCASRHNGVHFFDILSAKSGPHLGVFSTFWLGGCASRHNGVHFFDICKLPKVVRSSGVFCTFWLGDVLRATTACTFSTSEAPKVVRSSGVLRILTWKCASRHNGVQFFMSHLPICLRTRRFSEPTFRPSGTTNHWKNTVNRDFPTFSRICIFFLLTLSLLNFLFSLPLPCSAFHLSILSEV